MKAFIIIAIWLLAPGVMIWAIGAFISWDATWLMRCSGEGRAFVIAGWASGIVLTVPLFVIAIEATNR